MSCSSWDGSAAARQNRLADAVDKIEASSEVISASDYASLLWQCGSCKSLSLGRRIHAHIRSTSNTQTFLSNLLLQMYSQCGSLPDAIHVFHQIPQPDSSSWNAIISAFLEYGDVTSAQAFFDRTPDRDEHCWNSLVAAYARNGHYTEAIELLALMDLHGYPPDRFTYVGILVACTRLARLPLGRDIHSEVCMSGIETETVVGTAVVDMYGKSGCLHVARDVFERMRKKNVKTWTAMVAAYAQAGDVFEARKLFDEMPQRSLVSWNVLVAGYAQNGMVNEARRVFEKMIRRDVVTWSSLIAGYTGNGFPEEAIHLFRLMHCDGVRPNQVTYTSVLDACTSIKLGRSIHSQIKDNGFECFVSIGNSLITMFGRFGAVTDAQACFTKMSKRNTISWTAIIQAYARTGLSPEALSEFHKMELEGMKPNQVTLLAVLTACVHAGMEKLAKEYLMSLGESYGLKAGAEHYGCVVDLLARCGKMKEALEVVESMPFEPGVVEWTSLASGCLQSGGDERIVEIARENICRIERWDAGPFMLLAHAVNT